MTGLRVGHGYDVHRLGAGAPLILGGVTIPWEKGLDGHSDADVLTHAVMDALLGAAGMDDIGRLFPDCDNAFLNISSLTLLERVMKALTEQGWQVVNIDATLVAQAPKDRPLPAGDALCAGPDAGHPAGAGERQGHHGGASGLHRRGTGDVRPRRGADPAGGELIRKR